MSTTKKAINKAIKIVGSQAELARKLEVSPQFINQVYKEGRPLPSTLCKKIKVATGGKVMEWELRPDVFDQPQLERAS
jgi:DNA-binding transcriptional regulator YdaS (Cro superfamily)